MIYRVAFNQSVLSFLLDIEYRTLSDFIATGQHYLVEMIGKEREQSLKKLLRIFLMHPVNINEL